MKKKYETIFELLLVILIVGMLAFFAITIIIKEKKENEIYFSYNGVSLTYKEYKAITETFSKEYLDVRVCNTETGKCIYLRGIDNYQKILDQQ